MTSTDTTDSREMVALEIIDEPLDSVDEDFAADSHTDVDISDCSVEVSDEDDSDEDVSTFCEECKKTVLLNDKILRPYIKHTNKLGRIVRLDTAFGENAETEIHIGHVRYDTFPQLPVLVGSASRGCGFCALLKKVLATRVGSYEGRIGLHFSYKGSDCHGLQHHRDQSGLQGVGIFLVCVSFDHPNEEKLFESVDFNYKEDKDTHKKGKFRRGVCKENEKERDLVGESKEKEEETGEEKSGQEENIGVNWDERLELRFELESDQGTLALPLTIL
jgi:hypothetical protein